MWKKNNLESTLHFCQAFVVAKLHNIQKTGLACQHKLKNKTKTKYQIRK